MGSRHDPGQHQGILVPSPHLVIDTLQATDAATAPSVYTQAGGGPGVGVSSLEGSTLVLGTANGQETPIEAQVRRAGMPGRTGCAIVYRQLGEEDPVAPGLEWRGHNLPNWHSRWQATPAWGSSDEFEAFDVATNCRGVTVMAFARTSAADYIYSAKWESAAGEWGARTFVSVDPDSSSGYAINLFKHVSITALPSGRFLVIADNFGDNYFAVWYSDDDGSTWNRYSFNAYQSITSTADRGRICAYRDQLLYLVEDGSDDVRQFSSSDLGATLDVVDAYVNLGRGITATAIPGGAGILVAYRRNSDGYPVAAILASASQPLDTATVVVIKSASVDEVCAWADEVGNMWAVLAESNLLTVHMSKDLGQTWTQMASTSSPYPLADSGAAGLATAVNMAVAQCEGAALLLHNSSNPTTTASDLYVGSMLLGGWSNLVGRYERVAVVDDDPLIRRESWGGYGIANRSEVCHLGAEYLSARGTGWVATNVGAQTLTSTGELDITVAAGTSYQQLTAPAMLNLVTGEALAVQFHHRLDSGTPGITNLQNGIEIKVGDNATATTRTMQIRINAASIRVYDSGGGTAVTTYSWDSRTDYEVFARVYLDGQCEVHVRRLGSTRWLPVVALGAHTLGAQAAANTRLTVGSAVATTLTSSWRYLQWTIQGPYSLVQEGLLQSISGTLAIATGGQVAAIPRALGRIDEDTAVGGSGRPGMIQAQRGPGRMGETFVIEPSYRYGVQHLFPQLSPSPSEPWRSTDKAEVQFVWEVQNVLDLPLEFALALVGCNFRTAYLESSTNGTTWTTIWTHDAADGHIGVSAERVAMGLVRPQAGTIDGDRYLGHGELVGGYIVLDTAGATSGPTAREIGRSTAGAWTDASAATTPSTVLDLPNWQGSDPVTGLANIVGKSAVSGYSLAGPWLVVTHATVYIRLRIPANQETPWDYYQIGAMVCGGVRVFGKQSSRGFTWTYKQNVATSVSRYGVTRRERRGPQRKRWQMGWTDGAIMGRHRAVDTDYLATYGGGVSETVPTVARDDVLYQLIGIMEDTRGGEVPVVALADIPAGGAPGGWSRTITDRDSWLYGTITGEPSFAHVVGNEAGDSGLFGRVEPIVIEEIP